jgi:hypothetical protein
MSAPTLWGTLYCPYVQRAKIVFALVGKAYTFKAIDLAHKPAEYVPRVVETPSLTITHHFDSVSPLNL